MVAPLGHRGRSSSLACALLALLTGVPGCDDDGGDGLLAPSEPRFSAALRLLDTTAQERLVFRTGEPVTFELKVTNLTPGPQTLDLPSAQLFDFAVRGPSGGDVWRWSTGRAFATVLTSLAFAPHETREFTAVWVQVDDAGKLVAAGDYDASGHVPVGEPGLAAPTVRFRID